VFDTFNRAFKQWVVICKGGRYGVIYMEYCTDTNENWVRH